MNISGCGFEWLSVPIVLFTDSFRFIFLINWIAFLFLPGLIFSVFVRLQVPPRTTWWWMWLLASGWCYAMQASSIINDSFAVVYALASVDFALRARESKKITDVWFSLIAAALVIGAKQTIIPLVLICGVALFPCLNLLRSRLLGTTTILIGLLLVSSMPLFYFNKQHTGTWLGVPPNTGAQAMFWARCEPDSPIWGIVGNAFCIPAQNLVPPIFPWAGQWNEMMKHFLRTPFGSHFVSFEDFGLLGRAVTAGNAGLGLAICLLALISVVAARHFEGFAATAKRDSLVALDAIFRFARIHGESGLAFQCAAIGAILCILFSSAVGCLRPIPADTPALVADARTGRHVVQRGFVVHRAGTPDVSRGNHRGIAEKGINWKNCSRES
jgi:hypothetical protein